MQEFLPINLMVTSRPIPVVASDFCDSLSVDIRANETDIRNYVQAQIVRLPPAVQQDPSLQLEILNRLVRAVDGM